MRGSKENECSYCDSNLGFVLGVNGNCDERCGTGQRISDKKECDDGNLMDNDGCSATCTIESGWSCLRDALSTADHCVQKDLFAFGVELRIFKPSSYL
jgi:cysteine-rich repeat protein